MKRALPLIGLLILVLAIVWWYRRPATEPGQPGSSTATKSPPLPGMPKKAGEPAAAVDDSSHLADALNSPKTDIRSDLRVVAEVIDAYRTNFPRDGNPVGDNNEITAALTGHNKLGLALISPKHPAINKDGQLCDRWGTPFFFHADSGTKMEIRSAGPDRKMWNDDDVVFTP